MEYCWISAGKIIEHVISQIIIYNDDYSGYTMSVPSEGYELRSFDDVHFTLLF